MKQIEVLVKFPVDWFNFDQTDLTEVLSLRYKIEAILQEELLKQLPKIELPPIAISSKEVKDKMLTLLAERAISKLDNLDK
jgi:hypothetical protein